MSLLSAALAYAALGWQVAPLHTWEGERCSCGKAGCQSPAKHPRTMNGLKDATTDPRVLERWWTHQFPGANVAVVTGAESGIVILDVDIEKGGEESLEELQRRHGRLPATVEALTGGGGRHLAYRHPGRPIRNRQSWKELAGLDVRGDGGYVVAPPSRHRSGRRYQWEASSRPGEAALAEMPAWLIDLLSAGRREVLGERSDADEHLPPAAPGPVLEGCAWIRRCIADAEHLGEEDWYAMLSVSGRLEGGARLSHEWSRPHPGYSPEATEAKLAHALRDTGPASCGFVREALEAGECASCRHWGLIKTPLVLSRGRIAGLEAPPEGPADLGRVDDLPALVDEGPSGAGPVKIAAANGLLLLPHSEEAERALLGGLLQGGEAELREVLETVSPADCYVKAHDLALSAIRDLAEGRRRVDVVTVAERLRETGALGPAGGVEYLQALVLACPRGEGLGDYAALVRKKARLRETIDLCRHVERECFSPAADPQAVADYLAALLLSQQGGGPLGAVNYGDVLEAELARIARGEAEEVLLFGLPAVDRVTDGLGRGEVGLVCGRPGTGKSIWCAMQLHHAARTWGPTLYVSLEMGAAEVVRRDLAGLTGLAYAALRGATGLDNGARGRLDRARAALAGYARRIWIDEHASSLSKLISRVRRYRLQHQVQAVIVDYGQLVKDDTGARGAKKAEEVMRVARALKVDLAVPEHIPVWVAVQANRESEKGGTTKRLGFSDLGWSGEWEAVAGRVLFLNPAEGGEREPRRPITLDVHKNRHGSTGVVPLVLDGPAFRFEAVDTGHEEPPAPTREDWTR